MTELRGAAFARALVRLGRRWPWHVLAVAALVVAAGALLGTRLTFETDVLSLVPRDDPVVDNFRQTIEEFGSLDTLLVVVRVGGEERLDLALTVTDALEQELIESPHLSHVQAQLEDPVRLAEAVLRHAVLFLDAEGLAALAQRLGDEGLAARAADIRAAIDTPHGLFAKELALRDPLGLLPLLLGRISHTPAVLQVDLSSGRFLSADHSLVLVLAKPVRPAQDIDFDRVMFADLRERIDRARRSVAAEEGIELREVPEVTLGGGHRIAQEDASLIRRDIISNSVTSLLGVMLLFLFAYRRFAAAQYAFLPLAVGLALTFVFTALALGRLNSATSSFAALLVGLGIDFTIVMYGRYLEARLTGMSIADALDWMASHCGPAVLLGAITTVGTFYSFLATRFMGLKELGLLTGTGIVLMALAAFVLLPALVTVFDRNRPATPHPRWLDLEPALRWAARRRRFVLAAAAVVSVAALASFGSVRFDDDVRHLRSPSNKGVAVQEEVAAAFGISFSALTVRVDAPDIGQALERLRILSGGLDPLVRSGQIASYESLDTLIPPPEAQAAALQWIADHRDLTDPERVRSVLDRAFRDQGLVPQAFARGLAALESTLRPAGPVTLDVWKGTPVEQLVERSLRVRSDGVSTVINVLTPPGMWRRSAPPELEALVASVPGASVTGASLVARRLRQMVWRDAVLAGLLGLVVVFAMLLWELKGARAAALCLVPVAVGSIWMVGALAWLELPLNFLNVFVVTMVIGVGVDYGIHMLHRLREVADVAQLAETARSVVLAALTTIVGFGSLVLTHYPGLRSIGWMTCFGVLFSCITAVIILPLLVPRGGGDG